MSTPYRVDPTDIVINAQGTRLILNLRGVALKKETDPTFDLSLELVAAQNPAREPYLTLGSMARGTATSVTVT